MFRRTKNKKQTSSARYGDLVQRALADMDHDRRPVLPLCASCVNVNVCPVRGWNELLLAFICHDYKPRS